MRLVLDLQACQTASRLRGIGRYVGSLSRAILAIRGAGANTMVALDGTYPREADFVTGSLRDLLPAGNFSRYYYPKPLLGGGDPADPRREIASQLIARHHAGFCPDATLQGSLFEGYGEPAVTCEDLGDIPGHVSAVIAYDLIPLIYPDQYFAPPGFRTWYVRKLQILKNADVILAISESTKRDLIDLLGVPAERISVIHAGLASQFLHPVEDDRAAEALRRLGISRPYVLYTGNGDFRKNTRGAIEAFARLSSTLRENYQLVLNQSDRDHLHPRVLRQYGLTRSDVVATGHVSDTDLAVLYRHCETFLFPSLYEGFGLPVLEAMASGAAVIAGDNSSIPELIKDPNGLFDASEPSAIAACLQRVLEDANLRASLREQGVERSKCFTWERSAKLALQAIDAAVDAKRHRSFAPTRPRRRLAMFTPLPPQRTGIASYSAELLPALAYHFNIDIYTDADKTDDCALSSNFTIRHWQEFDARAGEYDVLLYQMGNSPFHTYMFDLLKRYPGVVVLHDFFLSSAYWYMDRHEGHAGLFAAELVCSHGVAARRALTKPGGDEACRERYPCNASVIESSIGIISHSRSVFRLLTEYGLGRIPRPIRIVPQLRGLASPRASQDRGQTRKHLGLQHNDRVVCSFGFIADTKLTDRLIDAFLASTAARDPHARLVLVGQLDGGDWGRSLEAKISASGLPDRIVITGFVDDKTYERYACVADVAVQLRARSRGETSRAVLDCLAHGVPLIVNAHGTLNDYPDDVVVRVKELPTPAELAAVMDRLLGDSVKRRQLAERGYAYVAARHSPANVAAGYAQVIDEMLQRRAYRRGYWFAANIASAVYDKPDASQLIDDTGTALERNTRVSYRSNLIIDVSEVVHTDYGTGIHRVVRNLTRELISADCLRDARHDVLYRCVPGCLDGADYVVASEFAHERLGVEELTERGRIGFSQGDMLLLLDSAWSQTERFLPVLRDAEQRGVEVIGYVYDLIPIRYPEFCVPEMPAVFRGWLEHTVRTSHAIICISRATAEDLINFITEQHLQHRPGLRIHYVHLGSDLEEAGVGNASTELQGTFAGNGRPVFLMVGTIEPRKGYPDAFDAFDRLWAQGVDVSLCIIGKLGWKMGEFANRLRSHCELGQRLFWYEHVADGDLDYAYRHAAALIQASYAEGFGLPLLEAAQYGTPIICTDIPVFHEVAGAGGSYFPARCPGALAELLCRVISEPAARDAHVPVTVRTWRDAAKDLIVALGASPAYRTLA